MATNNSVNAQTTNTTVVAGNGTGYTNIAYSATGSTSNIVSRDSNGNSASNNLIQGYTTTATAASTTTLTVASTQQQYFTGTTTQTIILPVTSTLVLGQAYTIVNNSTGVVTVQSSGANTIQAMSSNTILIVTVILTSGTTAASWNAEYSTNTISPTGSVTQYDVLVGGASNTITSVSPSTAGFILTSNGVSADPSFQASTGIVSTVPGLTFISSSSAGGAPVDFTTLSSTYSGFRIYWVTLTPGVGANMGIRCSTNGGSTYDSGSNYMYENDLQNFSSSAASSFQINNNTGGNNSGYCDVYYLNNANNLVTFTSKNTCGSTPFTASGYYMVQGAVNALRVFCSTNWSAGTIYLFGIQ